MTPMIPVPSGTVYERGGRLWLTATLNEELLL